LAGPPTSVELVAELERAERLEAALAAVTAGVPRTQVESAFEVDAARLAVLAVQWHTPDPDAVPRPHFVASLERNLLEAFDARPVRVESSWLAGRGRRVAEVAIAGGLAVALATGALLVGSGSLAPAPTAVPTAAAATRTATPAQVSLWPLDQPASAGGAEVRLAYLAPAATQSPGGEPARLTLSP
jgi:hypothetical protein